MEAQGREVLALCVGMPDYQPPPAVEAAIVHAVDAHLCHEYTATAGLLDLREAIRDDIQKRTGTVYAPDELCVCSGAKQAIYQVLLATCGRGDEIILPAPYWTSYYEIAKMTGARVVQLPLSPEEGFVLTAKALQSVLRPATKLIIFCNPCNPTVGLCRRHKHVSQIHY